MVSCPEANTHGSILTGAAVCPEGSIDLLQLVVPEELRVSVVEQHVEGGVVGMAPSRSDRTLFTTQVDSRERIAYPHPTAEAGFFGFHA